jgi:hypothetical protein
MTIEKKPGGPFTAILSLGRDSQSRGYFVLCSLLAVLVVLSLSLQETPMTRFLLSMVFALSLISAGYSVVDSRAMLVWVLGLGLVFAVLAFLSLLGASPVWDLPAGIAAVLFLLTVTFALLVDIVTGGHGRGISPGLIAGATAVYLLIGITFSIIYMVAHLIDPDAFRGLIPVGNVARPNDTLYFSFVTLSTLGYGDITPTTNLARMLSVTEAIIGQLYLTILVARLVGMQIAQESPDEPDKS